MKKNKIIRELILLLINFKSCQKDKIKSLLLKVSDWNELINISLYHQVAFLLYYNINKLQYTNYLPKKNLIFLKKIYFSNLIRNLLIRKEILYLIDLVQKKGFMFIPFKGIALLEYIYPDPGLRGFSDVDILVKEDELPKIKSLLLERGYKEKKQKNNLLFIKSIYRDIDCILELHTTFVPPRPYKIYLPQLWERLEKKVLYGKTVYFLSKEDTFISLALHLRRHTRNLILKSIYDISKFLFLYRDHLDWQYIFYLAKINHIKNTIYFSLYISREIFDVEIPMEIFKKFIPFYIIEKMIHLCINRNNFFKDNFLRGYLLRILLFDRVKDIFLYLYRLIPDLKICV